MSTRPNTAGLHPRNFPRAVRALHDVDYADQLSEPDQVWLAAALDCVYGASFKNAVGKQIALEQRREIQNDRQRMIRHAQAPSEVTVPLDAERLAYVETTPQAPAPEPTPVSHVSRRRAEALASAAVQFLCRRRVAAAG